VQVVDPDAGEGGAEKSATVCEPPVATTSSPPAPGSAIRTIGSTYSGAQPQSRRASRLPSTSPSALPLKTGTTCAEVRAVKTSLVAGLVTQMHAVRGAIPDVALPVRGALCFVGTELPWFGSSSIQGVPLVGRKGLVRLLRAERPAASHDVQVLNQRLATAFPPARASA
jgi:hypothetical protein